MMKTMNTGDTSNVLLDSPRLFLRRVEEEDQGLLERLFGDETMMQYLGGPWAAKEVCETLHEWHTEWGIDDYWYGVLVRKDTAEAIGIAGFTNGKNPDEAGVELSWFILPEQQNRGFATEITRAILDYIFEHLNVHRVFAETHPENAASNRVLQKLGFIHAGERRHHYDYLPGFERQVVWEYTRRQDEVWSDAAQ